MVTNGNGSRGRILAGLRAAGGSLSGEALSASLGISRVAVWRHVRALQALGYPIEAGRRGYSLAAETDLLLPWELPRLARRIVWKAETGSTMDDARNLAERGLPGGSVLVAERQTRGRGRNGRSWSSGEGGIYATFLRRDPIPAALLPRIGLAAALSVAAALERVCGLRASLKWPNDILVEGRKVAGILVEASTQADRIRWCAIGVGVNVRNAPRARGAGSLEQVMGRPVRRAALLAALCEEIDAAEITGASLAAAWNRRSETQGRAVEVSTALGPIAGVALGIDEWGALLVRRGDGALVHVPSGDCVAVQEVT